MKVINFFAEPSAGKSTTAAGLFFLMKNLGLSVELVTEYAKECVWEDKKRTLDDQLYITAKQNHQLERLRGKVDYAITDSPLLLGLVYTRETNFPSFPQLVVEAFNSYDNFNILLTRAKPYVQAGRIQTENEAKEVRKKVIAALAGHKYYEFKGNRLAPNLILSCLQACDFVPYANQNGVIV